MTENAVQAICVTVLVLMFWGTPDLMDAIIAYLMK